MPTSSAAAHGVSFCYADFTQRKNRKRMRYQDFSVRIFAARRDGYDVSIDSPEGSTQAHIKLPPDLLRSAAELNQWHHNVRNRSTRDVDFEQPPGMSADEIGSALYKALFSGNVARMYNRSYAALKDPEAGLRLRLHLNLDDPQIAKLAQIPWEYIYEKESMEYLALSRQTPIVRYIDVPRRPSLLPFDGELRILVVMSSPKGTHPLDLDKERQLIESTWAKDDNVRVDYLSRPTADGLLAQLVANKYHVLHYMGHGAFDANSGSGALVLESDDGSPHLLNATTLGTWLRDVPTLRLAFLNACDTGRAGEDQPFSGVANRLVMAGLPAVVVMQTPISDDAAIDFARAFYPRLAAGYGVDEASAQGRKSILSSDKDSTEWGIPVLYMRSPDGRLFNTPLPDSVQARPASEMIRGAAIAAFVLLAGFLTFHFWPETELEFAFANQPRTMFVGETADVLLEANNAEDTDLDMTDYLAAIEFDDPSAVGTKITTNVGHQQDMRVPAKNRRWSMAVTAHDAGSVPFVVTVERGLAEGEARDYRGSLKIEVDPKVSERYQQAINQIRNPGLSTSDALEALRAIPVAKLDLKSRRTLEARIQGLEQLNLMRASVTKSHGSAPTTEQLNMSIAAIKAWRNQFEYTRGVQPNTENSQTAAVLRRLAESEKTLVIAEDCLHIGSPALSPDLVIYRNAAVVKNHCFHLANGGENCNTVCQRAGQGRSCDVKGLAVAAESIDNCVSVVKAIGAGATFQKVRARSGIYPDDRSGCTFGDWEKESWSRGENKTANRWIQIMKKDKAAPTCEQINSDRSRMRVCACKS
jgi:hypothetical protein